MQKNNMEHRGGLGRRLMVLLVLGCVLGLANAQRHAMNFVMLPKGDPIPPSGPSHRGSETPPPPHSFARGPTLRFGMLPKGVPIPPSGPSQRTSDPPPPPQPFARASVFRFGMLPKGDPIPPSGPSHRGSETPPPPHSFARG